MTAALKWHSSVDASHAYGVTREQALARMAHRQDDGREDDEQQGDGAGARGLHVTKLRDYYLVRRSACSVTSVCARGNSKWTVNIWIRSPKALGYSL